MVISLISVHTSSFGSILVLNLYGGTKKYFERWSFSRERSSSDQSSSDQSSSDQSSSDQSCLLLVRTSSAGTVGLFQVIKVFERLKFE